MRRFLASFALVALGIGCAPSPEKVCKHAMELAEKEGDKPSEKKLNNCIKDLTEMKEKEPDQFKCLAPCANDAKDFSVLRDCDKKCKKGGKKKGDDDDDDKGKKKKKSDDD